jgi:hypothetical protein
MSSMSDTFMDNFVYVAPCVQVLEGEAAGLRSQRPNSVHSKCMILCRVLILMVKRRNDSRIK